MSIYQLIANFRNFLIISWPSITKILEHIDWDDSPYFLDEWIQANWEFMVEKHIMGAAQLLVPYGYNSSPECRCLHKGDVSTHRIVCKKKGDSDFQYIFLCFESRVDNTFGIYPPFDFVSVRDIKTGDMLDVEFEGLEFSVEPIT